MPNMNHQPALTFVVTTSPNDANSAANKKRVRSVAAAKSWPERRKRTFVQSEAPADPVEAASASASGPSRRTGKVRHARPRQSEISNATPGPESHSLRSYDSPTSASSSQCVEGSSFEGQCSNPNTPDVPCSGWRCRPGGQSLIRRPPQAPYTTPAYDIRRVGVLPTPPPSPSPHSRASNVADPFNCYPVPREPWFDHVLHHMLTVFAPRGWPALKITKDEGLNWEWFMTQHALAEPALFYVRLLFASGDLIRLGTLSRETSYWLQDQAIRAINEALSDPSRATSDPLILAVGRIALHESMYGNRQAANVIHRPAQQRMIEMRGGMKALDFPALVKRLMRWSDRVMAMQGGTARLLEEDDADKNYSLGQSVEVSED